MKAAVICSKGIGDALMMLIAAYQLYKRGFSVTLFQNHVHELSSFFPFLTFAPLPVGLFQIETVKNFDLIILQNDNSQRSYHLINLYQTKQLCNLSVFYASYSPKKHSPLTLSDRIFDPTLPMTENIAQATSSILNEKKSTIDNGIHIPKRLTKRRYKKRILIHPTSSCAKRTWSKSGFLTVAKEIQRAGFNPVFCVSPKERKEWIALTKGHFLIPHFTRLQDLASFVYESNFLIGNESGTGHLASNLGLPTLIMAKCPKQMALWRPGWHQGKVLTPCKVIPNIKGMRLKEDFWRTWVRPKTVLKTFFDMISDPKY